MATVQSERHFLWLMVIVFAAIIIVIELVMPPMTLFKLGVCVVALVVMGIAWFKRASNRRHRRT
jgi:membrane protein implicated in regulation of membrane protease activity